MMSSEKKSAGPTSCALSTTTLQRSRAVSTFAFSVRAVVTAPLVRSFAVIARSRCLCMFSIITIAASIIAPMAMAMPPSDMISAPTPTHRMAMNAIKMPIGSVRMATSADRACNRKSTHTSATIRLSSSSLPRSVSIARSIKSERSYTVRTTTPGGSPFSTCASFAFTLLMVSSAF